MSWHHADWLSFAQAVASTVAIAGAFGVVFLQHHLEGKRRKAAEREEARRVLRIAVAFTNKAWTVVNSVGELRGNAELTDREIDRLKQRSDLNQVLEAMNGLPIHILPTAVAAEQVIRARSELTAACFEGSKRRDVDGPGTQEAGAMWAKWAARLADATKKLRAEDEQLNSQ